MALENFKMYLFILFGYLTLVSGSIQENPACKEVKLLQNFNPARFGHGDWYQLARYNNVHETTRKCLSYNFKTDTNENTMIFKRLNTTDDSPSFFEAVGKFTNDDIKAGRIVFVISYGWPRKEEVIPVIFTATDYDNYAIVYSCSYDAKKKSHNEYAWILSRSKKLSETGLAIVEEYLNKSKVLNSNKLIWNEFSEESCNELIN